MESPLDVAMEKLDGLEILSVLDPRELPVFVKSVVPEMEANHGLRLWYRYLNCGFRLTATAGKLATEQEEEHGSNDDQKNYKYRHYCSAAATTITISHEIDPPLCTEDSVFVGDLIVPGNDWPGLLALFLGALAWGAAAYRLATARPRPASR